MTPFKIIFIGRPVKEKGLFVLLSALSLIKTHNWHLTIVGDIPEEEKVISKIESLKDHVSLLGAVHNSEICKLLNLNRIIVVPSFYENFGQVVIEAMACGKTIIASRTGGLKELVIDGVNGILFTPQSVEDLAKKIQLVFDSPDLMVVLESEALNSVHKYSWEEVIKQTLELFNKNL